jgi:DNA-binding NtrC family response regulator
MIVEERAFPGTDRTPTEGAAVLSPTTSALIALTSAQKQSIKILVVDDEETICDSCHSVLEQEGYDVRSCSRGTDAEMMLRQGRSDIVLLDLYMSGVSGLQLMHTALEARPDTIVIVITGKPSVESSLATLRDGAWNYLPKPFAATHLQVLVGRAAHAVIVGRESQELHQETPGPAAESTPLGESRSFLSVIQLARKVAVTDASVFITGESGTGKEMVAQYIHRSSRRRSRRMVAVNCAAMPETLLESEMFGHVKGAFTGAVRDKQGLMEVANGGTLFLDELTEMSPQTQAKLLRVVQDGVLRRVGSTGTDAVVNIRFIAATNQNPSEALAQGRLRKDLYYRLGVVPIHVPPLRERVADIPILATHFLSAYWKRHRGGSNVRPILTKDAIQQLQARTWKGNVRELQNIIEHSIVLADGRSVIDAPDLPHLDGVAPVQYPPDEVNLSADLAGGGYHAARERFVTKFERDYLSWVLHEANGNVSEAARLAGIHRATLHRLLEKHGLTRFDLLNE